MTPLSRWLARYDLVHTAAVWLSAAMLMALSAFAFASLYVKPGPGAGASALALLMILLAALLYARRGGIVAPGD